MPRRRTLLVVLLLLLPALPAGPAASQGVPRCLGEPATIVGTNGPDVIRGTPGRDVIVARGGDDTVLGLGGDDLLCGGPGNDVLVGGPGNDRLAGARGHDELRGGGGRDRLMGGAGVDACIGGPGRDETSSCSRLATQACSLPKAMRRCIAAGVHPTRSGEVQIVPVPTSYMGPGLTHAGPWDYLQRVPLFLYGPGFVLPQGEVAGRPTLAALAPTVAELVGMGFEAEEAPLTDALVAPEDRAEPPRLIVTLVWDAAGVAVLDAWPHAWPKLRALRSEGTWYRRAEVGSSPSNTPPSHATIGSGVYARDHGLTDLGVRHGGKVVGSWSKGPRLLGARTIGDLYDGGEGNGPLVGVVGGVTEHLGMIGRGGLHPGGDEDLAVLTVKEAKPWGLKPAVAPYYSFPAYANQVSGLDDEARALDQRDGQLDGRWRGHRLADLRDGFDSPARIPHQTSVVEEIIRREGFGQDDVPDLLYLNYKIIDFVFHRWGTTSGEMKDSIRIQDEDLERLIGILDDTVGEGRWVLMLTADHGALPRGKRLIPLDRTKVVARLKARFGQGSVERLRPTMVFVDVPYLRSRGHSLEEVSTFLLGSTRKQLAVDGVPEGRRTGRAFRAAFPSSWSGRLACLR